MTCESSNGTGGPAAGFPTQLVRWLTRRAELIDVLVALRHRGHAPDAIDALLKLPDVEQLRTEWETWLTVVDDADRAASLLLNKVPADVLTDAIYAFWGIPVRTARRRCRARRNISDCAIRGRRPRARRTGGGWERW
jgi:hypothetical protein